MNDPAVKSAVLLSKLEELRTAVGRTPLFNFSGLLKNKEAQLWGKLEWHQTGNSVKARAAFAIIHTALKEGRLTAEKTLLDASSGNTAIAYAHIAQQLGLSVVIVLPENASRKRKTILRDLGARVVYSSPLEGTDGAQLAARELHAQQPLTYFYADQYNNTANWQYHFETTGPEIWEQTQQGVTHFASGLGTTGTFVGVGRFLKSKNSAVQLIQMQPDSPMHGLEGWKHLETAKIPGIYDDQLADGNCFVSSEEALQLIKTVHTLYGLRISPSSAASLVGAKSVAEQVESGTVVTVLADDGSKYEEVYHTLEI